MTLCPEAMGREFGDFEKDVSWDPTLGRASPAGGYGMRSAFVGSDSTVSIVKIVCLSLSSCRKTKVKKLINVLYLNNGESSGFRISLHLYVCIVVSWLYNNMTYLKNILSRLNPIFTGLVWFLGLMAYQLFVGYLMPKPFS